MNAVERFIRSRVLLLTAAILIVAMALSVLVQGQSQAALGKTVDQNSRGIYDILVQAPVDSKSAPTASDTAASGQDATPATGTESSGTEAGKDTSTLMEPDIANGQGGISFDQLDKIRKLNGSAVAAPISLVSRVTQNLETPRLDAMDYLGFNQGLAGSRTSGNPGAVDGSKWPAAESVLPESPTKYRITASATSGDGVSIKELFKTSAEGSLSKAKIVEENTAGGKSVRIEAAVGESGIKFPSPAGGSSHNLFNLSISLPMAPEITESVVAVDPAAERALLGSAGDFLAPLEKAPPADGRNAGSIGRYFQQRLSSGMSQEDLDQGPDFLGQRMKYWAPMMFQYEAAVRAKQLSDDSQAIPLIVRSGTSLDLNYNVKIEQLDDSGNVVKDIGTVTKSLDKDYLPFVSREPFVLDWPGGTDHSELLGSTSSFGAGLYDPATWSTNFAGAPLYKAATATDDGAQKSAVPGEWLTVNGLPQTGLDGSTVDQSQRTPVQERSYRKDLATGGTKATPLPMVYGTFDPEQVKAAAGDVNRLPLGGYDPVPYTLTKDAEGKTVEQAQLKPSLSAAGLASQSAGAITDYYGLAAARGYTENADVIDAVRVRSSAQGGWKEAGPAIEKLAQQIRGMGLQATVVAGSAREEVSIFVPGYSKNDAGEESPLGTVEQSWVRQSAADAVTASLSATNLTLLFLTLIGATLLTAAATVSYVRLRRREAGILRAMGWNQKRIRSWVLQEFGVGAAALAVAGLILSLLSWNLATVLVSATVLVIYVVAAFLAAQQLRHRPHIDQEVAGEDGLITVDSPLTFANRQLKTNRFNTVSLALAVGVFGAAAGALVAVLIDLPRAAGSSALGGVALASVIVPSIILAVAGVAVGLLLTIVTGRFELSAKRGYLGTLKAMGWNPDMLRQVHFFENALVGAYAVPIGALGAAAVGLLLAPYAAIWAGVAGLLAVVLWVPIATKVVR
ncbi:FtsX-like permease family protein [Pseudarthrobacter sp. J1738]|uniref:FtsX-like permease family protein n=1 Tax=unclassified Pseudarthrobacter TaxID=2647000 RepID=UPI003D2A8428